jgi:hypothetical protein
MSLGSSCVYFARAFRKGGKILSIATITKLNIEKLTVRQLFRVIVKATNEINEASFIYGQNMCRYKVDIMAQGSELYVLNIFRDRIMVERQGISRHQHLV